MICKAVLFVTLVGAVVAEHATSSQQFHKHDGHPDIVKYSDKHGEKHYDYHTHPKYDFEYKVHDPHTHDHKIHHEIRDGHHNENVYTVETKHKHGDSYASVKRFVKDVVPVTIEHKH